LLLDKFIHTLLSTNPSLLFYVAIKLSKIRIWNIFRLCKKNTYLNLTYIVKEEYLIAYHSDLIGNIGMAYDRAFNMKCISAYIKNENYPKNKNQR
jgi:hypothetical protein